MGRITTVEALRQHYRAPTERAVRKQLDHLDPHCRRFIELSPFMVLASSRPNGPGDVSPRGGEAGFVRVLDATTVAFADSPGNNRLDTLENIIANPEVGMLFLVPGVDEALRVNGTAEIDDDAALRETFATRGRPPATVVRVAVREAYLHCAKAVMRARLWSPEARIDRSTLPSMGEMLREQIGLDGPAETQREMLARYEETLY